MYKNIIKLLEILRYCIDDNYILYVLFKTYNKN